MCCHLLDKILPESSSRGNSPSLWERPGGARTESTSTPGRTWCRWRCRPARRKVSSRISLPSKRVLVWRPIPKRAFAHSLRDLDVTRLLLQKTRGLVHNGLVLQLRRGAQGRINLC